MMKNVFVTIVCLSIMLLAACSSQETAYTDFDRNADFKTYKTFGWLPPDSGKSNDPIFNNNQIIEKNIRSWVSRELKKRGYTEDSVNPDLLVKFNLVIENKEGVISNPIYSTPNPYNQLNPVLPYNPFISNYGTYNNPNYNPYYYTQNSPFNVNYFANTYPYNGGTGYPVSTINGYSYGYGIPVNSFQGPYIIGSTRQTYEYKEGTIIIDIIEKAKKSLIWRGWGSSDITSPASFENHLEGEVNAIFEQYPSK